MDPAVDKFRSTYLFHFKCVLIVCFTFRSIFAASPAPARDALCDSTYQTLFANPAIEIVMVFGYKDSRPSRFVGDRHERVFFTQEVTAPCLLSSQACGFMRDAADSDHFTKTINSPTGKPVLVHLRVLNSSVSADDEHNQKDRFQKWQSQRVNSEFRRSLQKADIVFYNGHSRNGGGPDFFPPRLTADGHIDYTYYERETPGLKEITDTLKKTTAFRASQSHQTSTVSNPTPEEPAKDSDADLDRKSQDKEEPLSPEESRAPNSVKSTADSVENEKLKLLGLFSCASTKHFRDKIKEARPDLALITSQQLIYYVDALKNSLAALEALLTYQCEKDFRRALRSSSYQLGSQLSDFYVRRKSQK